MKRHSHSAARIGVMVLASALSTSTGQAAEEPAGSETPVIPAKVYRHAERLAARCDADGNGQVDEREWPSLGGHPREADANGDGALTVAELAQYIADYGQRRRIRLMPAVTGGVIPLPSLLAPAAGGTTRPPVPGHQTGSESDRATSEKTAEAAESDKPTRPSERKWAVAPSRLPPGLPDWFLERDRDGDGQLTLAEYATAGSSSADESFARYDRNHDGLVTPREVLSSKSQAPAP